MNFGFDIDGTITAEPIIYGALMDALVKAGHQVHVVTGQLSDTVEEVDYQRRRDQLLSQGIKENIHYHKLHIARGLYNDVRNAIKEKKTICQENNIVFMFEDSEAYCKSISDVARCVIMVPRNK
jgi:hypothetical protein